MTGNYYNVTILMDKDFAGDYHNYLYNPTASATTYQQAIEIAKPWIISGYNVIINRAEEGKGDCIEIPLDCYEYIRDLTSEQKGIVLQNVLGLFFAKLKPSHDDPVVLDITMKMINRIKEFSLWGIVTGAFYFT